jgi:hypothetical protein
LIGVPFDALGHALEAHDSAVSGSVGSRETLNQVSLFAEIVEQLVPKRAR